MADDTTMTCARLTDTLDDYLDGRAARSQMAAVDTHLAECAACRLLVADVRAIRAVARTLEPLEPPAAVWAAVRARVASGEPDATVSWLDHLLGWTGGGVLRPTASLAMLTLLVGSLAWVSARLGESPAALSAGTGGLTEFTLAEAEYFDAIAGLEAAAAAAPRELDEETTAELRASIDDVDSAIVDARAALEREPGDPLSQETLLEALGVKVELLQDNLALLGEAGIALDAGIAVEDRTP
jgi:anti-sigma factor RsiW